MIKKIEPQNVRPKNNVLYWFLFYVFIILFVIAVVVLVRSGVVKSNHNGDPLPVQPAEPLPDHLQGGPAHAYCLTEKTTIA